MQRRLLLLLTFTLVLSACGRSAKALKEPGQTALMSAAWKGNVEVVDLLLARHPDLKIKDYR